MAFNFMIIPDPEEGWAIDPNTTEFCASADRVNRCIQNISGKNPQATICVYQLGELHKLKTRPTYQKYTVKNGEVLPA